MDYTWAKKLGMVRCTILQTTFKPSAGNCPTCVHTQLVSLAGSLQTSSHPSLMIVERTVRRPCASHVAGRQCQGADLLRHEHLRRLHQGPAVICAALGFR